MLTYTDMAAAYDAGLSCAEISDCLRYVNPEQVRVGIINTGASVRRAGQRPNERLRAYVSQLIDTGKDFTEIARQAGCSQSLVAKVARLKGW